MKLALGTVQFGLKYGVANTGERVSLDDAKVVVDRARLVGITTLDTAIAYGESESVLGQVGVQGLNIVTKLSTVPDDCNNVTQWVTTQIRQSLQRLQIDRVHGLLLHRPSQLSENIGPELYAALQSLKAEGVVKKIGVSIYGAAELDALQDRYAFDLVQAPLNILDRSFVESGWALRLKEQGVEVHTRSAFLQGLLLIPAAKRPTKFERWSIIWAEWDRWLAETGLTPLQACLRFTNTLDCIDQVIVGVDSIEQLEEIIDSAAGQLPSLPQFDKLLDDRLINPATWNQL